MLWDAGTIPTKTLLAAKKIDFAASVWLAGAATSFGLAT